jgi:hypothetical protein
VPTTITKTIKPSGGDYTSLSAFVSALPADLTMADQIWQAECYVMEDTTPVVLSGHTTDATRYIRIYTPLSQRHNTLAGTGYRLQANSFNAALKIVDAYVRVEGIAFTHGSNGTDAS